MSEQQKMEFPETFEKFAKEYGFKDDKEVYTNGIDLIPIYRVKQWLEHDNKLRTIETDTAYECGKHANKWIPVSDKLPEDGTYLVTLERFYDGEPRIDIRSFAKDLNKVDEFDFPKHKCGWYDYDSEYGYLEDDRVIAWMSLPKPYGPRESEVKG